MAITAGTIAKDRTYRSDDVKALFEPGVNFLSTSVTFKQGDLLCYDTAAHVLKLVAATGDAATIIGVAQESVTAGVLVGPYTGLSDPTSVALPQAIVGPFYGLTASMILNTGDAFNPGIKVYLVDATNSQTVGVTDPGDGNYVGLYVGPVIASATAGQEGQIKIGCRYPAATGAALQF